MCIFQFQLQLCVWGGLVQLPDLKNCDFFVPGFCKKSFQKPHWDFALFL